MIYEMMNFDYKRVKGGKENITFINWGDWSDHLVGAWNVEFN